MRSTPSRATCRRWGMSSRRRAPTRWPRRPKGSPAHPRLSRHGASGHQRARRLSRRTGAGIGAASWPPSPSRRRAGTGHGRFQRQGSTRQGHRPRRAGRRPARRRLVRHSVVPRVCGRVGRMKVAEGTNPMGNTVNVNGFNPGAVLPYSLRTMDFQMAMQDVYDLFRDINCQLVDRGLRRLEDMLRPAAMSGMISDMLTASLANHSRALTENRYFNGHPDLLVEGVYPNNAVQAGTKGVEIKSTRKAGGAVDTRTERGISGCAYSSTPWTLRRSRPTNVIRWRSPRSFSRRCRPTISGTTSEGHWVRRRQL